MSGQIRACPGGHWAPMVQGAGGRQVGPSISFRHNWRGLVAGDMSAELPSVPGRPVAADPATRADEDGADALPEFELTETAA